MRRALQAAALVLAVASLVHASDLVPYRDPGFNRNSLLRSSSVGLLDPNRFGMQQSYSMSWTSGSMGSQTSGVYLNTLSYRFSIPLVLSADIGVYNLFAASGAYSDPTGSNSTQRPDFVFPRIGLDYRPTDNVLLSLQFLKLDDAYRAYGPYGYSSSWRLLDHPEFR